MLVVGRPFSNSTEFSLSVFCIRPLEEYGFVFLATTSRYLRYRIVSYLHIRNIHMCAPMSTDYVSSARDGTLTRPTYRLTLTCGEDCHLHQAVALRNRRRALPHLFYATVRACWWAGRLGPAREHMAVRRARARCVGGGSCVGDEDDCRLQAQW